MKDKKTLKYLWKNSKGQRFNTALLIFTSAVFSVLSVLFALAVKKVVDGATDGNREQLVHGAIFIVVVIILQFAFRVINKSLQEYIKGKLEMNFRSSLFDKILKKNYAEISAYHSGELMNALTSDVNVICDGLTEIIPEVFSAVVRLVTAVIVLLTISYVFALAFLGAGIALFIATVLMRSKIKYFHKRTQETDGKTRSYYQENIENILAVKVFANEDKVLEKSDELQKVNFALKMKRRNYSVLGHAFFNFVASAGYVFALIYGGALIFNNSFGYGDLTAVLQLVNSVQMPFVSLASVFPKFFTMISSAERLIAIEEIPSEDTAKKVSALETYSELKSIVFDNVVFAYDKTDVLDGLDFSINKGEIIAVTGSSGIGKSTLLKLMLGVYPLKQGSIYFETEKEKIGVGAPTRSLFSYVPQGNMLFSGTVRENLAFVCESPSEEDIERALKISASEEFVSELEGGIDFTIGEGGKGLSEGQIQRLAIARAVLSKAPIVLLDEATSALDEKTEKTVLQNLKTLGERTVFIVTHKKAALAVCDKKIKIEEKKAVFY